MLVRNQARKKPLQKRLRLWREIKTKALVQQGHYKKKKVKDIISPHNTMPEPENCLWKGRKKMLYGPILLARYLTILTQSTGPMGVWILTSAENGWFRLFICFLPRIWTCFPGGVSSSSALYESRQPHPHPSPPPPPARLWAPDLGAARQMLQPPVLTLSQAHKAQRQLEFCFQ